MSCLKISDVMVVIKDIARNLTWKCVSKAKMTKLDVLGLKTRLCNNILLNSVIKHYIMSLK